MCIYNNMIKLVVEDIAYCSEHEECGERLKSISGQIVIFFRRLSRESREKERTGRKRAAGEREREREREIKIGKKKK